jgi:hypothetical protein
MSARVREISSHLRRLSASGLTQIVLCAIADDCTNPARTPTANPQAEAVVSALQHRESGHGEKRKRASTTEDLNQETHQTAAGERSAFSSLLSSCRAGSLMSNH